MMCALVDEKKSQILKVGSLRSDWLLIHRVENFFLEGFAIYCGTR